MRLLLDRVRTAKEALSSTSEATIQATLSDDQQIDFTVSESDFATLTEALVARTLTPTRKALRDAKVAPAEIKGVVLVGGATRMPVIRRAGGNVFRPAAVDQSRSRSGRGARCRHPGGLAGGKSSR